MRKSVAWTLMIIMLALVIFYVVKRTAEPTSEPVTVQIQKTHHSFEQDKPRIEIKAQATQQQDLPSSILNDTCVEDDLPFSDYPVKLKAEIYKQALVRLTKQLTKENNLSDAERTLLVDQLYNSLKAKHGMLPDTFKSGIEWFLRGSIVVYYTNDNPQVNYTRLVIDPSSLASKDLLKEETDALRDFEHVEIHIRGTYHSIYWANVDYLLDRRLSGNLTRNEVSGFLLLLNLNIISKAEFTQIIENSIIWDAAEDVHYEDNISYQLVLFSTPGDAIFLLAQSNALKNPQLYYHFVLDRLEDTIKDDRSRFPILREEVLQRASNELLELSSLGFSPTNYTVEYAEAWLNWLESTHKIESHEAYSIAKNLVDKLKMLAIERDLNQNQIPKDYQARFDDMFESVRGEHIQTEICSNILKPRKREWNIITLPQ